jgi:hypothetical protein
VHSGVDRGNVRGVIDGRPEICSVLDSRIGGVVSSRKRLAQWKGRLKRWKTMFYEDLVMRLIAERMSQEQFDHWLYELELEAAGRAPDGTLST